MGKNFASVSAKFRADFWDSGLVSGTRSAVDYKEGEPRTKHEQKQALREKGITSFHEVAKSTNITAKTAKGYVGVMTEMGKWLRDRGASSKPPPPCTASKWPSKKSAARRAARTRRISPLSSQNAQKNWASSPKS